MPADGHPYCHGDHHQVLRQGDEAERHLAAAADAGAFDVSAIDIDSLDNRDSTDRPD